MLDAIFRPMTIRGKTIRNRLVVPPMVTDFCTGDGKATERYIAYHEEKAKGGWGLIITEDYGIDPKGRGFSHVAGLWNDEQMESHAELPARVHAYGAVILAQIYHCGRQTNRAVIGQAPVAPSPIACPFGTDVPRELTVDEIHDLVNRYAETALRAKKCGFDGVQIHGAHGYLVCEFLSPYTNKRTDEYGGSFLNRARFALEIIRAVRKACGEDFIIDMRVSGRECVEGGLELEDIKALVPLLEAAGLDMIHVSVGNYLSVDDNIAPASVPHAWTSDWAKEVKSVARIPVTTVSRINDPFLADSLLRQGKADFVAMGRASLADPHLPRKAMEGRFEDIRRCIACNDGCIGTLFGDRPIRCALNPTLGREYEGGVKKAELPRKVAVVGAGPAGLYAAMTAKEAGHDVTVYEKSDRAGGQFYAAAIPPCKGELADFIAWQKTQCAKLGIDIRYRTEASVALMKQEAPDVVVLATGAVPAVPPIPGVDGPAVVTALDVLLGRVFPGRNCVVIGGGQVGVETAHFLAQMMRHVTVLEMRDEIAPEEAIGPRTKLLRMLEFRRVELLTQMRVLEITYEGVRALDKNSLMHEYAADTVVIATGSRPCNGLAEELAGAGFQVRIVGDALKVGRVLDATTQGYDTGNSL